jgi:hypothetical protein
MPAGLPPTLAGAPPVLAFAPPAPGLAPVELPPDELPRPPFVTAPAPPPVELLLPPVVRPGPFPLTPPDAPLAFEALSSVELQAAKLRASQAQVVEKCARFIANPHAPTQPTRRPGRAQV